jgi:hypothetical protein
LRTIIICIVALLFSGPAAAAHHYTVHVDAALDTLRVTARFASPVQSVRARHGSAGRFLLEAADCETGLPLERRGRTLTSPQTSTESRVIVRFLLGDGVDVSVPWQTVGDIEHTYEIPPSPRSARAPAAFGRFIHVHQEPSAGMPRIALLRSPGNVDDDAIIDWILDTVGYVSLAYGRFPNPGAHVVVMPVGKNGWRSDSPVPFGRVVRDGGESIELFIDKRRPIEDFYDDWTATHEFSHRYEVQRAWQKLYEGFERGRKSRPELSANEASRRGVGAATMKIYWSGAIVALMADVELRERSGGRESLDDVLDRLQRCCLPAADRWTGPQLFGKLDSLVEEPVFMPLYQQYADKEGFPDIAPLFRRLGVDIEDGRVALHDDAELASVRDAITRSASDAGARAFIDRSRAQQAKRSEP